MTERKEDAIRDCPTPLYHETHRFCPSCPWVDEPLGRRHVLKTAPAPWMAVRSGVKTAEFRRDDRGFEVGDILDLRCVTEDGDSVLRRISHIVRGPLFGIPEGYAMLSFAKNIYETVPREGGVSE